jgi:hypothetical protein
VEMLLTERMEEITQESGMATAEYAIATIAAVGFAGLLVMVLKSDGIHSILENIITTALAIVS